MIKRAVDLQPNHENISPEERRNLIDFLWRDVYEGMVNLDHTSVYVRGLGTFQMGLAGALGLHAFYCARARNVGRVRGYDNLYYLDDVERIRKLEDCIVKLQNIHSEKNRIRHDRYKKFIEEQSPALGGDEK